MGEFLAKIACQDRFRRQPGLLRQIRTSTGRGSGKKKRIPGDGIRKSLLMKKLARIKKDLIRIDKNRQGGKSS